MNREKTKQVLQSELKSLEPVTAWKNDDGSYQLFGAYHLTYRFKGYQVKKLNSTEVDFCSKRAAVAWCIADQHQDRVLASRVRMLDSMLERINTDIVTRKTLSGNSEYKSLVNTKLEHKLFHRNQLENDLNRCVRLAKRYQRGLIK